MSDTQCNLTKTLGSNAVGLDDPNELEKLALLWSVAAQEAGAAALTVTDDTGNPNGPALPVSKPFKYLENGYIMDDSVTTPEHRWLDSLENQCKCKGHCVVGKCDCIAFSGNFDEQGYLHPMYNTAGLFDARNEGYKQQVQECTADCACTKTVCGNRVAQQPRDIEMDIFKTVDGQWCVRNKKDIVKGKVLGVYTGKIIRLNKEMENEDMRLCWRLGDASNFVFIDYREETRGYAVDANECGNWTRWISNSVNANLRMFVVIREFGFGTGKPYLGIAAMEDIPAGTTLTLDFEEPQGAAAYGIYTVWTSLTGSNSVN